MEGASDAVVSLVRLGDLYAAHGPAQLVSELRGVIYFIAFNRSKLSSYDESI
jgi:hypothetical protein